MLLLLLLLLLMHLLLLIRIGNTQYLKEVSISKIPVPINEGRAKKARDLDKTSSASN